MLGLSVGWWIGRSVVCFDSRFVDRSFVCLIGWLVSRCVGYFREQITFSPASPVPIKGNFWNFISRAILTSATNGASLVGIGQLQRARCLKNTIFSSVSMLAVDFP
jgi:hypothetical protein